MSINRAVEIFGMSLMDLDDQAAIKSKYRELARTYHPDFYGDGGAAMVDINEAYDIIKEAASKIIALKGGNVGVNRDLIIITTKNLIDIYNGESLIQNTNNRVIINKSNIRATNPFIMFTHTIRLNNIDIDYSNIIRWNPSDVYEISCELPVTNLTDTHEIKVFFEGREKDIRMSAMSLTIKFSLSYNIYVAIVIKKVLKK